MAAADAQPEQTFDGDISSWRILLLFLLILGLDTFWEYVNHKVDKALRHKSRKGLRHAWSQIKFEVMALGLISLMLVVFEVRLWQRPVRWQRILPPSWPARVTTCNQSTTDSCCHSAYRKCGMTLGPAGSVP